MKRFITAALALFVAVFLVAPAAQADVNDFEFKQFSGDYYLSRGEGGVSELRVVEKLVAQFPQTDQNHGIERAIPETYQDHGLELRIANVTDDHGNPERYTTRRDNGYLIVRIGDADKYVHGEKGYKIEYTMRGVIDNINGAQNFYWDINGDAWKQQFTFVEARVHIPKELDEQIHQRKACYTGARGSTATDCTIGYRGEADGSTTINFATQRPLQAGQTLTVAVGFAPNTFQPYSPSAWQIGEWVKMALGITLPPIAAFVYMFIRWRRKGRDAPAKTTIVPQYLPPKHTSVLASSAVFSEGFNTKAMSATIIDLAVRHYIRIYETSPDKMFKQAQYELELIKSPLTLHAEEKAVVDALFGNAITGARVSLKDLKNKLSSEAVKIGKDTETIVTKAGYFATSPTKARAPYYILGAAVLAAAILPFVLDAPFLGGGLLLAGIIIMIFATVMPARTIKGAELRSYLLGVRDYIKLAEAERLKVLQSPHGKYTQKIDVGDNKQLVKLYEKLLPYAMLFGLEKDWAKQMGDLYERAPDWYSGASTFNAAWFASSVGGFGTQAQSTFLPAGSSSGAGGAGGGGGGGGGGGW